VSFKFSPRWQEMSALLKADPEAFYALMEDRERQLEAFLDFGPETYTPTLEGTGGVNPNVGTTGYSFGLFTQVGRLCDVAATISFNGTGITGGTGAWNLGLPLPIQFFKTSTGADPSVMGGKGWLVDASASPTRIDLATELNVTFGSDVARLTVVNSNVTATNPWAGGPAAGDFLFTHTRYWIAQ